MDKGAKECINEGDDIMGMKPVMTAEQKEEAIKMVEAGAKQKEVAEKYGVKPNIISYLWKTKMKDKVNTNMQEDVDVNILETIDKCQECKTHTITEQEQEIDRLEEAVRRCTIKNCDTCENDYKSINVEFAKTINSQYVRIGELLDVTSNLKTENEALEKRCDNWCKNCSGVSNEIAADKDNKIKELESNIKDLENSIKDLEKELLYIHTMDTDKEYESKNIKRFRSLTDKMIEIYKTKNKKYGDSFGKTYREYGNAVLCIRLEDKLARIKQILLHSETGTDDESVIDSLIDAANYSIMAVMELQNK